MRSGIKAKDIVFSSVGKQRYELELAPGYGPHDPREGRDLRSLDLGGNSPSQHRVGAELDMLSGVAGEMNVTPVSRCA
ncbi:hypothetical protein ABIE85_006169 [Bradyrhizobium diazoefficiens]|uniref:hypothetical protein n=1 Tax=Bradyrhizobium diazoefficiens TaxID=1355477 RepID=UPI00351617BE